jgi:uncharacterized protein (DUF362 family)
MYSAFVSRVSGNLDEVLTEGLDFIDWTANVRSDSTVFVKPNFTFPTYSKGVTTSPELLRILLGKLKDRTSKVIVGESNGGSCSFTAEAAFKGHNMYKICRDVGADLVNLSNLPSKFVESKIQGKKVKVQLPELLLNDIDCLISVPTLKVHVVTQVSLGMKNLWGCYPDTMRGLHHQNLAHKLTLLAKVLKPKITLIDGLYGLNNHGPMYGTPVNMNLVLASNNIVVADTLGTRLMKLPVKKIKHISIAEKEGLGTTDLAAVRINTDWSQYCKQFRLRKTILDNASMILVKSDLAAKIVMDSSLTPILYSFAGKLKSRDEKITSSYLSPNKRCIKNK